MSVERLKFRGKVTEWFIWRKHHQKMLRREYSPGDWMYSTDLGLDAFFCAVDNGHIDPATVGQWTGMKDDNGVDIYEGDICEVCEEDCLCEFQEQDEKEEYPIKHRRYVVKWFGDQDYAAFDLENNPVEDYNGLSHYLAVGKVRIVGNIHDKQENDGSPESDNHTPE